MQSFQKGSQKVAFIGDGLNDAPVLQVADLGIAVSSASDLAKQSADIVLLTKDIQAILEAFELAQKGMRTIRQNLFWAIALIVLQLPFPLFLQYLLYLQLIKPDYLHHVLLVIINLLQQMKDWLFHLPIHKPR